MKSFEYEIQGLVNTHGLCLQYPRQQPFMEFQINASFVLIGLEFKQSACCFNFLPLGRPVWGEFSLLLLVLMFVTLFP